VRIKIVLASGLALISGAVLATLLHSPSTVASTNGVQPSTQLMSARSDVGACQAHETVPGATTAIRLQIVATTGPLVSVEVLHRGNVVTHGTMGAAWYGGVVTVPIHAVGRAVSNATICFQLRGLSGEVEAIGTSTSAAIAARSAGKPLPGRVTIAYLRPESRSWLSLAGSTVQHMQLGRAASGPWIVVAIAVLATAAIAVGAWTVNRELR
jgi:hypothetical protein